MADETNDVMKELQDNWSEEVTKGVTDSVKAGGATAKCLNAFLNRSQKGRKQLNMQIELLSHAIDPSLAGKKLPVRFGLETVDDFKRVNSALTSLELEIIRQPQDVLRVTRELDGICFNCTIAENKDPQFPPNVYINAGARRRDLEAAAGGAGDREGKPAASRF